MELNHVGIMYHMLQEFEMIWKVYQPKARDLHGVFILCLHDKDIGEIRQFKDLQEFFLQL